MSIPVPVSLKWGKASYNDGQITIIPGSSARDLKLQVQSLTGVPARRQKLLCPQAWRGALNDDDVVPHDLVVVVPRGKRGGKCSSTLVVTLVGSAETLAEFDGGRRRGSEAEAEDGVAEDGDGDDGDVVDIVALQMEAGMDRDDGRKAGTYEYNRLVTGLPQHHIDDVLESRRRGRGRRGRRRERGDEDIDSEVVEEEESTFPPQLLGEVAMTMGAELRRAYVNSIDVLRDGTIVSGLDDGHVQLWRRGRLIRDARHEGGFGGVDHVRTFPPAYDDENHSGPSFVTAGGGTICLWTEDGHRIGPRFDSHPGTSPASIACGRIDDGDDHDDAVDGRRGKTRYLAACFRVTREVDPNQFRLVPQNEAERRRRDDAVAREMTIRNELMGASRVVRIWTYGGRGRDGDGASVRETTVSFDGSLEGTTASITHLLDVDGKLVSGDAWGAIRTLEWSKGSGSDSDMRHSSPRQRALFQFVGFSIACLERVGERLLAVSIEPEPDAGSSRILTSATPLRATSPLAIYLIDVSKGTIKVSLDAHRDTVRCICPLPDGGILSAGGKLDATVRLWDSSVVSDAMRASDSGEDEVKVISVAKVMDQPGYVFDLKVLPDANGSNVFAIAAARYNVIKLII